MKAARLDAARPSSAPDTDQLAAVQEVQGRLETINDEVAMEVLKLQSKANVERAPVYESRRQAIAAVPGFWKQAICGHPLLSSLVTQRDEEILDHLTDVDVEENADVKSGYRLRLTFSPNPFFRNAHVEKRLSWLEDGELTMRTTELAWKPGYEPFAEPRDGEGGEGEGESGAAGGGSGAAAAAAAQKRTFDDAMAADDERAPLFMLLLTRDDVGGGDACEEDERAVAGAETEAVCEAIKDELWTNPLQWYHAASAAEEYDGARGEVSPGCSR